MYIKRRNSLKNFIFQKPKLKELEKRCILLQEQNSGLMEANDSIRSFKHDFNNIIQAIYGYILIEDMEALKKYFNNLFTECISANNFENLSYDINKNPAIYGILLDKCKLAKKKNIEMNIEILMDFEPIKDKSYVISRMLGILLDNAIEAAEECEEKRINIQFYEENMQKKFLIENTYNKENLEIDKIFNKDYTTKRANSGLGLWKVKDIVNADESIKINTSKTDELFSQTIVVFGDTLKKQLDKLCL